MWLAGIIFRYIKTIGQRCSKTRKQMHGSFVERKLTNWLLRQTSASGVRRVAFLNGAIASEQGNVRSENQDKAVIVRVADQFGGGFSVAIVADGIGGMIEGGMCASRAIGAFVSELSKRPHLANVITVDRVTRAMHAANEVVYSYLQGRGGTTFVAVVASQGIAPIWVSAGDSRVYAFTQNKLRQISVDDTIAGQLGKAGNAPAEHYKLLQFVGMGKDFLPHVRVLDDERAEVLLLTTDGVHYLSRKSDVLDSVLQHAGDLGIAVKRFVDIAKWCGGSDNATIAAVPLPMRFESAIENEHSLVVWDSFGELHIELRMEPTEQSAFPQQLQSNSDESAGISETYETEPELIERYQKELLAEFDKPNATKQVTPKSPRKKATAPRKAPVDKKIKPESGPQLDIRFSPKTEL